MSRRETRKDIVEWNLFFCVEVIHQKKWAVSLFDCEALICSENWVRVFRRPGGGGWPSEHGADRRHLLLRPLHSAASAQNHERLDDDQSPGAARIGAPGVPWQNGEGAIFASGVPDGHVEIRCALVWGFSCARTCGFRPNSFSYFQEGILLTRTISSGIFERTVPLVFQAGEAPKPGLDNANTNEKKEKSDAANDKHPILVTRK